MNKEEKALLVKDLCARLPYAVEVEFANGFRGVLHNIEVIHLYNDDNETDYVDDYLASIDFFGDNDKFSIENFKPCLFPLSSITEEQKRYINDRWGINEEFDFEIDPNWGDFIVDLGDVVGFINWCYENHFDINGLIPRGFAEDATDKNIY
jgi:hypothetical protein